MLVVGSYVKAPAAASPKHAGVVTSTTGSEEVPKT